MLVTSAVRRGQAPSKRRGHYAARPRGALIVTRTRTHTRPRHHVACPRGAMIRPYAPLSDQHPTGINPARDGGRAALASWLRLPSDGDKPRRNEHRLMARLRNNGHHAARPRGALIETRTRTPAQRRHRVACPRGAMIRSYTPLSDQYPTGTSPDVMASSLGSHAGYDYRPTGASPIETNTAVRRG